MALSNRMGDRDEVVLLDADLVGSAHEDVTRLVRRASSNWDREEIVQAVSQVHIKRAFADRGREAAFFQMMRESIAENLAVLAEYLEGADALEDMRFERPAAFAAMQAEIGVSRGALLSSYRTGGQMVWANWATHLSVLAAEEQVSPELELACLRWSTARILAWSDRVQTLVDEVYAEREYVLRRSGSQAKVDLVREILEGEAVGSAEDLYPTLRYDVSAHHLVVQLSDVSEVVAHRLAERMRASSHAAAALTVRMTVADTMVWLARHKPWTAASVDAVVGVLHLAGVTADIAEPAVGMKGFRSSYDDLTRVELVRSYWSSAPRVVRYADVRLEALLMANVREAQRFAREELGLLAEDTDATRRLRETLLAWFEFGSHVATAEYLGMHEHTVRNRLQRAEQLLGRRLSEHRVELQAALRLHRLGRFADEATSGPADPAE
jgi:hypothetical protein